MCQNHVPQCYRCTCKCGVTRIFLTQYTRILIIYLRKFHVSSSSALLLIPTKKNLKVIFASCYIIFNIAMTNLTYFCSALFQAPKCQFCFTNSRVRHVVATACGNYTLRLLSGIQWYKVYISLSQCVCVCVCVVYYRREKIHKIAR